MKKYRRIQNDCWGCKTWRRGPREPVIAQKGYGIKPGPQAVETLLSCEEDRGNQNWHQRQESSPSETPNRTEDILGRTNPQWACGPVLASLTMGHSGKQVSGLELGARASLTVGMCWYRRAHLQGLYSSMRWLEAEEVMCTQMEALPPPPSSSFLLCSWFQESVYQSWQSSRGR